MARIIPVKVSQNPKQVNTKFGKKTVCNFLNQEANASKSQREIVVWRSPNDEELMSLKVGQQIRLLYDGKKYIVVPEPHESHESHESHEPNNGNGTAPQRTFAAPIDSDLGDLELPESLTLEQKRALKNLIQERAALMRYCIDTMREEVLEKGGYEMHENSIRSLGVSLFIHVNKYIP